MHKSFVTGMLLVASLLAGASCVGDVDEQSTDNALSIDEQSTDDSPSVDEQSTDDSPSADLGQDLFNDVAMPERTLDEGELDDISSEAQAADGSAALLIAEREGTIETSLSAIRTGFQSRRWIDRNADSGSTTVSVSGCSRVGGTGFKLFVELFRHRRFQTDISHGKKNISGCKSGTAKADWGRVRAGTYYLKFTHYDFGTVSASSVVIRY